MIPRLRTMAYVHRARLDSPVPVRVVRRDVTPLHPSGKMNLNSIIAVVASVASLVAGQASAAETLPCAGSESSCPGAAGSSCAPVVAGCTVRLSVPEPTAAYDKFESDSRSNVASPVAKISDGLARLIPVNAETALSHGQGPPLFLKVRTLLI